MWVHDLAVDAVKVPLVEFSGQDHKFRRENNGESDSDMKTTNYKTIHSWNLLRIFII